MIDWRLVRPLFPLFGLSLLVLGGQSLSLAINQAGFILLGLVLFFLVSAYPFETHRYFAKFYLILALILLILPYLFGAVTRGSIRWVPLGNYSLQPSELVKPLLIMVWSAYLSRGRAELSGRRLLVYTALLAAPFFLVFKQPDLGTSLVLVFVWLGLLAAAGLKRQLVWLLIIVAFAAVPLTGLMLKPYQKERLAGFLNPYRDPAGSGYQVIQALIAVGNGGWLGEGLGQGSQSQLRFLPEKQTDFIFSSLAEELGLAGSLILLFSYWLLLKRLLEISEAAGGSFGRLLAVGVMVMIWFQAAVTIGMNLGVMPVTGITLPLVSAGGSSLLATMVSLGLAGSVWKFSQTGL